MTDQDKTKIQLIAELAELRRRVAEQDAELARCRQAEADQQQITNCLPVLVATAGLDGYYKQVNPAFEQVLGWSEQESLSRPFMEFIHPEDQPTAVETFGRLQSGETIANFVDRNLCKDGSQRWINWTVIPVLERGVVFGIGQDITEKRLVEVTLKQSRDELELRVRQRTAELTAANEQLQHEVERRRLTEAALRKSEERYRVLVEASPDAVVMSDLTGQVLFASQRAVELLGFDRPEELLTRRTTDFVVEEERPQVIENLSHLGKAGVQRGDEYTGIRKDGTRFPVEVSSAVIRNASGHPKAVIAVVRDISEQKKAQEELQASEEKYRTLVEVCPDAVILADLEGRIEFASRPAVELPGAESAEDLCGREVTSFIVPEDRQRARDNIAGLLREGVLRDTEYTVLRVDGTEIPIELSSAVVRDGSGCPRGFMSVGRDISERRQAQEALQRERQTLLHMLRASDRERRLIAYEIHDELAQRLAAAIMHLQTFDHLREEHPEEAKAAYDSGVELLQQTYAEARRLISGVRPPVLDEYGIATAIEHLANEQPLESGIHPEFRSDLHVGQLPAILQDTVYRVVQEALANVRQHSRSEWARVSLVQEDTQLRVEVEDRGVGFDPGAVPQGRFGLEGIRERARLLGGQCSIESGPGKGTRILVVLPVVEQA